MYDMPREALTWMIVHVPDKVMHLVNCIYMRESLNRAFNQVVTVRPIHYKIMDGEDLLKANVKKNAYAVKLAYQPA